MDVKTGNFIACELCSSCLQVKYLKTPALLAHLFRKETPSCTSSPTSIILKVSLVLHHLRSMDIIRVHCLHLYGKSSVLEISKIQNRYKGADKIAATNERTLKKGRRHKKCSANPHRLCSCHLRCLQGS